MAKRNRKSSKKVVDVKAAAANDTTEVVVTPRLTPEEIIKNDEKAAKAPVDPSTLKGVALGIYYAGLAGRPSKQAVTAVFSKSGYNLNWIQRAQRLGQTPQSLCEEFKANPAEVKARWEALMAKKETKA